MTFQRIIQTLSLAFFLWLLWHATYPLSPIWPVDAYLKLDPLNAINVFISSRKLLSALGWAVFMVGLTAVLGRFFCGYLCPLGITVDITDRVFYGNVSKALATPSRNKTFSYWRWMKYAILTFVFFSALFGISLAFFVSPVCLITQFYALVLTPALNFVAENSLRIVRPLGYYVDNTFLAYLEVTVSRYQYHWMVALTLSAIFVCGRLTPRFWCRYLCPSGALFALMSRHPILHRHVSSDCTRCGICQKKCPMAAIEDDPFITNYSECIACQTCVRVCPVKAITFTRPTCANQPYPKSFLPHRRKLVAAGLFGVGSAILTHTGLFRPVNGQPLGSIAPNIIRPPGALPEIDFLATCIRCGLCMKACPTNTLQPLGIGAGLSAYFSPILRPQRGPCEPRCNACGEVCPTKAIRNLPLGEKLWAKMGTAYILRHKCLAWEFDKKCLVCDEVCPYGAISLKRVPGMSQAVPFVNESRCSGCGYCEHHCPVHNQSAIIIEPMDAFRLAQGSHKSYGEQRGYSLSLKTRPTSAEPSSDLSEGLPPGFSN